MFCQKCGCWHLIDFYAELFPIWCWNLQVVVFSCDLCFWAHKHGIYPNNECSEHRRREELSDFVFPDDPRYTLICLRSKVVFPISKLFFILPDMHWYVYKLRGMFLSILDSWDDQTRNFGASLQQSCYQSIFSHQSFLRYWISKV